ncbi:hypothetical protein [uncultured Parasphingorhabdus sp.]|uniref:hypothetical protein n=1 Tax=uncultured Parasphingorhabdus sp. TaxID=2709694 RepID=UPI003749F82A
MRLTMPHNNDDIFSLRNLAINRDQARADLKRDTAETRERLKPANLVSEAKSKATQRMRDAGTSAVNGIRANPGLSATVAATATLIAMRKPIARLIANRKTSEPDQIEE